MGCRQTDKLTDSLSWTHTHTHTHTRSLCVSLSLSLSIYIYIFIYLFILYTYISFIVYKGLYMVHLHIYTRSWSTLCFGPFAVGGSAPLPVLLYTHVQVAQAVRLAVGVFRFLAVVARSSASRRAHRRRCSASFRAACTPASVRRHVWGRPRCCHSRVSLMS